MKFTFESSFFFSRLVERVDLMKSNAIGNGSSQCVLCGDEFRLLGASPSYCDDCKKVRRKNTSLENFHEVLKLMV